MQDTTHIEKTLKEFTQKMNELGVSYSVAAHCDEFIIAGSNLSYLAKRLESEGNDLEEGLPKELARAYCIELLIRNATKLPSTLLQSLLSMLEAANEIDEEELNGEAVH